MPGIGTYRGSILFFRALFVFKENRQLRYYFSPNVSSVKVSYSGYQPCILYKKVNRVEKFNSFSIYSIQQLISYSDICTGNQNNWGRKSIFCLYLRRALCLTEHLSSCIEHSQNEHQSNCKKEEMAFLFLFALELTQ